MIHTTDREAVSFDRTSHPLGRAPQQLRRPISVEAAKVTRKT
jgi:hypothetical protein